MTDRINAMDRASFIRTAGGMLSALFVGRAGLPGLRFGGALEHPEPREGITSEHVLSVEALSSFKNRDRMLGAFESARAYPAMFDGVACACSCGGQKKAQHRSLLSCYETLQPTGCGACQEEGELVGKLAKEGKSLAEIRQAVDKWNA